VRESLYTEGFLETVQRWDGSLLQPSSENRRIESVRVFKAGWFEHGFATAHPSLPGVFWGPVVLGLIYSTTLDARFRVGLSLAMFAIGFLAWTLIEYLLHRFMFHLAPEPTFESKFKQFMMHGYHHEFPNDRMRLVAPLVLSVPIAAVTAGLYFLLGGPFHWRMLFAGTVLGYITYDWVHYYTHHFRPTTRLGKFLRRYHMEHHYKDSGSHFGISSPLWDWVFGTAHQRSSDPEQPSQEAA
jgi:sterol desaturase/sphingolipid hydroxylase (fatty acid hydroxylase superfamily)